MYRARAASAIVLIALTTSAVAQEKAEHPEYASWARFPKGTSVTLKQNAARGVEYPTKWYKDRTTYEGVEYHSRRWLSDDVPGMLVKEEWSAKGRSGSPETSTTVLVGAKKP